jgi:hypothetical protein
MGEYVTPETTPIRRPVQATTSRVVPPAVEIVPATDALPAAAPAALPSAPAQQPAPAIRRSGFRALVQGGAWAAMLLVLVALVATEGVAWVAAERFRRSLDSVDGGTLAEAKSDYDGIRARSVLCTGLRLRVNEPLRSRLLALADSVIVDYRREEPTMAAAEWKQAQQALRWAAQLGRGNRRQRANLLTCDAHVIRLAARGQTPPVARATYRRAIDRFRAAAASDDQSFDPYLGISRIAVYGLGDVDQAGWAIREAEKRGYVSGRRERALLGDGYLRRATATRLTARRLSGEQRRRELEKARADYQGCIDAFDPIVGFGESAKNLEVCKGQLERIDEELGAELNQVEGF